MQLAEYIPAKTSKKEKMNENCLRLFIIFVWGFSLIRCLHVTWSKIRIAKSQDPRNLSVDDGTTGHLLGGGGAEGGVGGEGEDELGVGGQRQGGAEGGVEGEGEDELEVGGPRQDVGDPRGPRG